jgi:hypothetical protein
MPQLLQILDYIIDLNEINIDVVGLAKIVII